MAFPWEPVLGTHVLAPEQRQAPSCLGSMNLQTSGCEWEDPSLWNRSQGVRRSPLKLSRDVLPLP